MNTFKILRAALLTVTLAFVSSTTARADASLKSALDLSMDQARAATEIRDRRFPAFQKKRGEYHTQMRKLRRARIANDSAGVVREDAIARRLHAEMVALIHAQDDEIRTLLTPAQSKKFDAYLELQRANGRDDQPYTGR